jgi:hypothetical protein
MARASEPLGFDSNGVLTERRSVGDVEVIVHYDDIPASDLSPRSTASPAPRRCAR